MENSYKLKVNSPFTKIVDGVLNTTYDYNTTNITVENGVYNVTPVTT